MSPLKRMFAPLLSPWRKNEPDQKGYREFRALHNVSFEIRKGESWGIIGVNGSGKSTLLKIISGNLRPSAGTVEVDGKVAILDYGSGVSADFTGRENIYIKGALFGLSQKELDKKYQAIVEFADIGDFIDQPVKTYSSGMCARLGFAIMMHVNPDIMIADEALAVGDVFFVQKCMRYIRSFIKQGTFLFVSHSVSAVMTLCSHAVWLDHGCIVRIGKAKEVCQAYMSSVNLQHSKKFLEEENVADEVALTSSDDVNKKQGDESWLKPSMLSDTKKSGISAQDLAALRNYHAPQIESDKMSLSRTAQIEICQPAASVEDVLVGDGAVGGGKILSVTITNDQNETLSSVLGGEIVNLTIKACAESQIKRPIIGFQLKNNLGLALIAENTFLTIRNEDFTLQPGELITARFRFVMPLITVGEYVILAGLAEGVEDNNALIDVKHEALVLRCLTSGIRHGLVGAPMIAIDVVRDGFPKSSSSDLKA